MTKWDTKTKADPLVDINRCLEMMKKEREKPYVPPSCVVPFSIYKEMQDEELLDESGNLTDKFFEESEPWLDIPRDTIVIPFLKEQK